MENGSGGPIDAKLWAFTRGGRAFDPGALAAVWNRLAGTDWDNLWAASDGARQRTAAVAATRSVLLVNAHQGALEEAVKDRIEDGLIGLTPVGGSDVLFTVDDAATPAITLSDAADTDTDTVPIPRMAPLPAGPYAAFGSATPFAGWTAGGRSRQGLPAHRHSRRRAPPDRPSAASWTRRRPIRDDA